MKYADEIVKEIEEMRRNIDISGYMVDKNDEWENYMRGIKPKGGKDEGNNSNSRWYLL